MITDLTGTSALVIAQLVILGFCVVFAVGVLIYVIVTVPARARNEKDVAGEE